MDKKEEIRMKLWCDAYLQNDDVIFSTENKIEAANKALAEFDANFDYNRIIADQLDKANKENG